MRWFRFLPFAVLLMSVHAAQTEEPSLTDRLKNMVPSISVPALQDVMGGFNAFTQQLGDTLPVLEEMGYEVSTFRVQWSLPPTLNFDFGPRASLTQTSWKQAPQRQPAAY
jgi:hypothetical protein